MNSAGHLSALLLLLAFAAAGLAAAQLGRLAAELQPGHDPVAALVSGGFVSAPWLAVGVILRWRRPDHRLGWVVAAIGIAVVWATGTQDLFRASLAAGGAGQGIRWLNSSAWALCILLLIVLIVTFPQGRAHPGRAGRLDRALVSIALGCVAWTVAVVPAIGGSGLVREVWLWVAIVISIVAIGTYAHRLRGATGTERAQQKWFAWSLLLPLLGAIVAVATTLVTGTTAWEPAFTSMTAPPVAIGIAVTRYRLYEIDRLISRTIGWAVISGVLVAAFAGGVVAMQAALAGLTQGETLAVAASTLLAAALFQPLRGGIQTVVDRRFDRARYDGERTAAAFAERLRDEIDLDTLSAEVRRVAGETVRPVSSAVWLRIVPDSRETAGS